MKTITMQDVQNYWKDQDYMKLVGTTINDFCRMWATEEGIYLPETFSISEHNSLFFSKMNSEKHAVNTILDKFNYPIIETESLTFDVTCATTRATQLFREHGHGVIRANKMAGGGGTYIIEQEKSIPMMISTLLNHPKGKTLPLFSPYYEAAIEYGVFLVNGEVSLCIAKQRNEETGLHNLSLGAKAKHVTDTDTLHELTTVCSGLAELFGIGFGRIDIMQTTHGLKIVELSVPNFKKFSLQDESSMALAKQLFLQYYSAFYQ